METVHFVTVIHFKTYIFATSHIRHHIIFLLSRLCVSVLHIKNIFSNPFHFMLACSLKHSHRPLLYLLLSSMSAHSHNFLFYGKNSLYLFFGIERCPIHFKIYTQSVQIIRTVCVRACTCIVYVWLHSMLHAVSLNDNRMCVLSLYLFFSIPILYTHVRVSRKNVGMHLIRL